MKILSAFLNMLWVLSIGGLAISGILAGIYDNLSDQKTKKCLKYTKRFTLAFVVIFGFKIFQWSVDSGILSALINMLWLEAFLAMLVYGILFCITESDQVAKKLLIATVAFVIIAGVEVFKWSVTEWPDCGCGSKNTSKTEQQSKSPKPPYRQDTEPWDYRVEDN